MADVSQLTPTAAEPGAGAVAAGQAGLRRFFARLVREQPLGAAGGIVILLLVLVSIFADALAPYRYEEIHLRDRLQAPTAAYLLGTDHVGRDLLSRLIHGARLSLTVGLAATVLTVVVAVLIGGITGFIGGRLDLVTQRFVDAWMAFRGCCCCSPSCRLPAAACCRSSSCWGYRAAFRPRGWCAARCWR